MVEWLLFADNISIELLQAGAPLENKKPWHEMKNIGHW